MKAIDLVFRKGADGEIYNIVGGTELSNAAVTQILLTLFRKTKKEIEFVADRAGHDFRYALSNNKIERDLGWKPRVSFEDGIKKTIAFYKKKAHTE